MPAGSRCRDLDPGGRKDFSFLDAPFDPIILYQQEHWDRA
jgi:hypothetical protein